MSERISENQWRDSVLNVVLKAIATSPALNQSLVFKGARILKQHLGRGRFSMDIDSSFSTGFMQEHKTRDQWKIFIESELPSALRNYFSSQELVRYEFQGLEITHRPKVNPHPRGWNGLIMKLKILDSSFGETPVLDVEINAPERYDQNSIQRLIVEGIEVNAYTLARCVGEKFRAYLSMTRPYREKIGEKKIPPLRVKDLYDISLSKRVHGLSENTSFWNTVGAQFRLACESRYVDCAGIKTFEETWGSAQESYQKETTLQIEELIGWEEVRISVEEIIGFFESQGLFPIEVPLPTTPHSPD
jgi:hypothetical protein